MRPGLPARLGAHAAAYAMALLMAAPFLWMVSTSLKRNEEAIGADLHWLPSGGPGTWQWGNYAEAWQQADLGRFYINSIIVAVVVTAVSLVHNALAGFAFAKLRFGGRGALFAVVLATMLLPFQVYFIFAYLICGWLGYVDSLQALIVPFLASAFGVFYMRQTVLAVPDSLLEAGRIDGFTDFELFRHIVVPAVRPGLAALGIFTFMWSWNNFFWPLIVIDSSDNYTLPLGVAALASGLFVQSWPVQMAAATIITVPTIIVFLVFQRRFVEGIALTGVKG
jgi:multiple sugar transport system permease protein